jgi:hypothetical protein
VIREKEGEMRVRVRVTGNVFGDNRGYLCGCEFVTAVGKIEMSCYF